MKRQIFLCGLGAFILTFAFLSWRDGLWRYDAAPVTRAAPQPHTSSQGAVASTLFDAPPKAIAPAAAAAPAATAIAPPEPVQSDPQSEPYPTPAVDNGAMLARRDRGAERDSRSR
jgi:hypothetical protein